MEVLCAEIVTRGWAGGTVGVEMDNYYFSAKAFATLQSGLPNVRFRMRPRWSTGSAVVKSPQELDYMRKAARIVESQMKRIFDIAEPGVRKCDLIAEIYDAGLAARTSWR